MFKKFTVLSLVSIALVATRAFADDVVAPSSEELMAFIAALGGLKNLGALGIVGLVIQGIMLLLRSPLASFAGVWRLLIVSGLSLVGGVITQVAQGVGIVPALLNASTLAAIQVFVHQIVNQVKKAPSDKA